MKSIELNNGILMPMEGFGVFQVDDSTLCEKVVLEAIEAGYRMFDTAFTYGNESAVGRVIRNSGLDRGEFFISTKAWISDMGYKETKAAFDRSVRFLEVNYIDLFLIHMPLGDYYGAWKAMEELYRDGRIRAIGVSNFSPARLMDLCYNCEIRPQVNQIELHPHYQRQEDIAIMRELGVQPQAWAPFAEGMKGIFTEPAIMEVASKHGKTPAQVILRWNIERGVVVIPKSVHRDRMEQNLDVWDFSLDGEDMAKIASLDKGRPSMLDLEEPSEIKRLYSYLENPILTTLK